MKLTVIDRLMVPKILLETGSVVDGIVRRDVLKKTELTQAEATRIGLRPTPDGGLVWDAEKAKAVDVEFTEAELMLLKRGADEHDRNKSVHWQAVDLVKKIWDACEPSKQKKSGKE